jgi:hypothetical protein
VILLKKTIKKVKKGGTYPLIQNRWDCRQANTRMNRDI